MSTPNIYIHSNLLPLDQRGTTTPVCSNRVQPQGLSYRGLTSCQAYDCRACGVRVYVSTTGTPGTTQMSLDDEGLHAAEGDLPANLNELLLLSLGANDAPAWRVRAMGFALAGALGELGKQEEEWGHQLHSPSIWLDILTEEVGEYAESILDWRQAWAEMVVQSGLAEGSDPNLVEQLDETEELRSCRTNMKGELVQIIGVSLQALHDLFSVGMNRLSLGPALSQATVKPGDPRGMSKATRTVLEAGE